jgi:hypothetical protein
VDPDLPVLGALRSWLDFWSRSKSRTCVTVTIITENVMARRRAGEICPLVTGSTELRATHYGITALARAVD